MILWIFQTEEFSLNSEWKQFHLDKIDFIVAHENSFQEMDSFCLADGRGLVGSLLSSLDKTSSMAEQNIAFLRSLCGHATVC